MCASAGWPWQNAPLRPEGRLRVRQILESLLRDALRSLEDSEGWTGLAGASPELERSRDPRHGDFTSNVAMRVAKRYGQKPREFAQDLKGRLAASELIESVEVAGPGFVNLRLSAEAIHREVRRMLAEGASYGSSDAASGRRVLVEYVSSNPTGPLHVGHGRNAAHGASLANLLRATGHVVEEEYYVNDAGRQIDILAASVWLRYTEALGSELPFPGNAYQGGYVRDIAARLVEVHGAGLCGDVAAVSAVLGPATGGEQDSLDGVDAANADSGNDADAHIDRVIAAIRRSAGDDAFQTILDAALDEVLADIRDDLAAFSVRYDRWFSERALTDGGAVDRALKTLEANGHLYEKDGATWFRSTALGDDKDRVVVRENGAMTYFASDIAYHLDKCERGYDVILNVLGSDHHGYVARLRAAVEALTGHGERLEARLVQFVVLYRGDIKVQMSTRSGQFVTLRALREEVGNDAARFIYVSRSNDQHLDFDLELAKSQSSDNPVYYVQYAHARIASMLQRMANDGLSCPDAADVNLGALRQPEERSLMVALGRFPEIVQLAADNRAPHHVVHYVRGIAAEFHAWYNARRILVDDAAVRDARVTLALAVRLIVRNALGLLGVSAPESM